MFERRRHTWIEGSLKAGVIGLFAATLYYQVWQREGGGEVWRAFLDGWSTDEWWLAALALLLMPVNWMLESRKWRLLMSSFGPISFRIAMRGVAAGIAFSLFTPNRLGEYAGRVLVVEARDNWPALLTTAVGNLCQLIVLLTIGGLGTAYFSLHYLPTIREAAMWLLPAAGLLLLVLAWSLFNLGRWSAWLGRYAALRKWTDRFREQLQQLRRFRRPVLLGALLLAALRYLVYSTQYALLLRFFGIDVPPDAAYAGIAALFFIQTALPLPPLLGLVARGEIALLIWGVFGANEFSILAATFSVFIINLVVPALLGMAFVVKIDVLKSLGYEKRTDQDGNAAISGRPPLGNR